MSRNDSNDPRWDRIARLRPRDRDVLAALIAYAKLHDREIAAIVGMSVWTLKGRNKFIYRELGVEGRLDLYKQYHDLFEQEKENDTKGGDGIEEK